MLVELRRRGTATARELAATLDLPPEAVRAALRPLVDDGQVERTGHGRSTRYHAW